MSNTGSSAETQVKAEAKQNTGTARSVTPETGSSVLKNKWTIMLYIAADATLANFAIESLKQLHRSMLATPKGSACTVTFLVQFVLNAPGGQQIPRYRFDENSPASLANCVVAKTNAPDDISDESALMDFMKWCHAKEGHDSHYALILWGHGPELLMQPQIGCGGKDGAVLYLLPQQLRTALTYFNNLQKGRKIDLVAFDACSMSMFEMAYEISECADFMVASQEEVPDPSFPYDSLVDIFRRKCNDVPGILEEGVKTYVANYQDYIANATTGMKQVTLSALRLDECRQLKVFIDALALSFIKAEKNRPALSSILLSARNSTRDYVGGLYVDLYDFCHRLYSLVDAGIVPPPGGTQTQHTDDTWLRDIAKACEDILTALSTPIRGVSSGPVLLSRSADQRSHGVSLYFPYLSHDPDMATNPRFIKGGTDTIGKGLSNAINSAFSGLRACQRRDLVVLTEAYYEDLLLSQHTAWYKFLYSQWTKYLIAVNPDELDYSYSSQQAAVNAIR